MPTGALLEILLPSVGSHNADYPDEQKTGFGQGRSREPDVLTSVLAAALTYYLLPYLSWPLVLVKCLSLSV